MYKSGNPKIQECIFNIDMVCRSMYLSYEEIGSLKLSPKSAIYGDVLRYRYIQLCTILDEFEILHGIAKNDPYLRDTLFVISPVTKALSKYNGIKRARNTMLAHFNRDKKKQFNPWWIALRGLNLPENHQEIEDIYRHLHLMNMFLLAIYYEDLNEITNRIKPEYEEFFKLSDQKNRRDLNPEFFKNVAKEVEQKMTECGIAKQLIVDPVMTSLMSRIEQSRARIEQNKP